jgi:hypothetical protein
MCNSWKIYIIGRHFPNRRQEIMTKWARVQSLLIGCSSLFLIAYSAMAADICTDPSATCTKIRQCLGSDTWGRPIGQAIAGGDGIGIGVETAACQHMFFPSGDWDNVSRGCTPSEYARIGNIAAMTGKTCASALVPTRTPITHRSRSSRVR